MLVKLQRPPPEINIFLPGFSARSSTTTFLPRFPASIAHISPAAPAPSTITSNSRRSAIRARRYQNMRGAPLTRVVWLALLLSLVFRRGFDVLPGDALQ